MRKAILITIAVLAASLVAFAVVSIYGALGRAAGIQFDSLGDPDTFWWGAIGFGSMWMIAISAVVLVALFIAAIVMHSIRSTRARDVSDERVPIHS